ncbi:TolC family protein [Undibacterium griseum]|uniref:TolC family protein n=1 Tax=Undibacterium griseum TaxID=2762295 RepID=A0ABR6YML6_9BURK|nr:TolC family protein [Undibacterium griseum]MBC3885113.1 TolC family protein [Undibacterium griseum]
MSFSLCTPIVTGRHPYTAFKRGSLLAVALASAVGSFSAHAQDSALSLNQALQLAVAHSRQLPAQDMAVNAAREMAVAAAQLPDPVLKIGVDNLPLNGPDRGSLTSDFMTMRRVGIMQELTRSEKRRLRAEIYDRNADRSLAEKSVLLAALQRDTAIAWLDRLYAERMVAIVAEQAAQARLEAEAAEGSYRAGRGTQADIFAARSALAMVDDRMSEAQRKLANAKILLRRWTGSSDDKRLAEEPRIDQIPLATTVLESALPHHPQIAALTRQIDIAQADARLAEANKKTDWSVEVAYQQRGPAYSNMVSIGFSLPFQWDQAHRQDRELSAKLALLEQAKAERDEALRAHNAETQAVAEEWQSDLQRLTRYQSELIPLAGERTQASLGAYRGGKANLSEVLAARRNEIDTRLQALQLRADTARLWAQLNFMIPSDTQSAVNVNSQHKD